MKLEDYRAFTETLTQILQADLRVLGLIAVGSMAEQDYKPDEWSDHDFFVVVESGLQNFFRTNLEWLPESDRIAFSYQETEHGSKVLYSDGHLLEFAVFDLKELHLAKVNRYRILIDRGPVRDHLAQILADTTHWAQSLQADDRFLFGQFLTNLLVAAGRFRRGERLSALSFLYGSATRHLALLICKYVPALDAKVLDNIDPLRRLEAAYPDLALELERVLTSDVVETAVALLRIADRELKESMPQYPGNIIQILESLLAANLK